MVMAFPNPPLAVEIYISLQLENVPSKKRKARSACHRSAYSSYSRLPEMSNEDKRELVQRAFAGKDTEGRRLGVYVRKTDNPAQPWEFIVRGILAEFSGLLPLTESQVEEILGLDEIDIIPVEISSCNNLELLNSMSLTERIWGITFKQIGPDCRSDATAAV